MKRKAVLGLLLALPAMAACSEPGSAADSGADAGPIARCVSARDCDDGSYCNGVETCTAGTPGADARGCVAGPLPCGTVASCTEATHACSCTTPDADGDGARSLTCGGIDCDDADPSRFPGAIEVCDVAGHDEDCDPATYGVRDLDGDGHPDATCCNHDASGDHCGDDCDDARASVNPDVPEVCNGIDDDCDHAVDEGVQISLWADADHDLYGAGTATLGCAAGPGLAALDGDCNDASSSIHPGLPERCDPVPDGGVAIDENCDGIVNPSDLCLCTDGMSTGCMDPGVCHSGVVVCVSGAWSTACSIGPSSETCNMLDDDCDGVTDETTRVPCYADPDDDGYAATGAALDPQCRDTTRAARGECPHFFTDRAPMGSSIDCGEGDAATYPGATELCDTMDDDCSSGGGTAPEEDSDHDGHVATGAPCTGGLARDDCNDADARVFTGQTMFFATDMCPFIASDPMICTGSDGREHCLRVTFPPFPPCDTGPQAGFDYDCSGAFEMPVQSDGCAPSMTPLCGHCGTGGYSWVDGDTCGAAVPFDTCTCRGTSCGTPMTDMRALPCH